MFTKAQNAVSYADTFISAITARKYVVASLSESGDFSMSAKPAVHDTQASANAEIVRLSRATPGKAYVTMQFIKGALMPRVISGYEF